jgi:hypothetical protein
MPMPRNKKLGIHTAKKGVMAPLTENEVDKVENMMYKELNARPIPKCSPMPPLTFREANETPINVIIKAANGMEKRL